MTNDKNIYKQCWPQSSYCKINKTISMLKLNGRIIFLSNSHEKNQWDILYLFWGSLLLFFPIHSMLTFGSLLDNSPSAFLKRLAFDISAIFLKILITAPVIISFSWLAKSSLDGWKPTFPFVSKELTEISTAKDSNTYLFPCSYRLWSLGNKRYLKMWSVKCLSQTSSFGG